MTQIAALLLCQTLGFLDQGAIFSPPIAHPRSVELGMDMALTGHPFADFVAVFGGRLPIATLRKGEHRVQLGFDGGVWTQLARRPEDIFFPVHTSDYLAALPIMYRVGGFSAELVLSHISAHRVDGSPRYGEPVLRYSVEFLHARGSYERRIGAFWLRHFVTVGAFVHTTGTPDSRFFLGGGLELLGPWFGAMRPVLAFDIDWYGDHDSVNSAMELGLLFAPKLGAVAQVRVALNAYSGKGRDGQDLEQRRERIALGVKIRFADWIR